MCVLPGRRSEDQIRLRVNGGRDIHTHTLAGDEAVTLRLINGKSPLQLDPFFGKAPGELLFKLLLRGPTYMVG
jgi:hypothetical protein